VSLRVEIDVEDRFGPEVVALLADHLASMHEHTPAGSVHALDLDRLRAPAVTFWTARVGGGLAGCAALRELDPAHGEVKSMRTAPAFLRRGVAGALLEQVLATARERGYVRVSLETGSGPAFEAAHALYLRHGFVPCGPFGGYVKDPFSQFLTLAL
jgi:putative acetyltransferase